MLLARACLLTGGRAACRAQAWTRAVLEAVGSGTLLSHAPLVTLLELHVPLVVHLQARARGLLARKRRRQPRSAANAATSAATSATTSATALGGTAAHAAREEGV